MKFNEKGELIIDIWDVIERLSKEDKLRLVETLSCNDELIKHVADQLIDGFTENVYCGSGGVAKAEPFTQLDIQRRRIALNAGEVAKKEIEDMQRALKQAEDGENKYRDMYYALYHDARSKGYNLISEIFYK